MREETFTLSGPADLDISVPSGSLVVESGSSGSARVSIDTSQPDAWRVHQSGDSITISYERGIVGRGGRARVRVIVPDRSSLKANTAAADVRATLELDRAVLATASGDVVLGDAASASIKSASGDIQIGRIESDLSLRSASGDVRIDEVGGSAALTTASGNVTVQTARGPLAASSASGDLRLGAYLGEDLEGSTMSGDLDIGLPSGRSVKLKATTLSGSVRLPERRQTQSPAGRPVSVNLKSVSGDITIRRVD